MAPDIHHAQSFSTNPASYLPCRMLPRPPETGDTAAKAVARLRDGVESVLFAPIASAQMRCIALC